MCRCAGGVPANRRLGARNVVAKRVAHRVHDDRRMNIDLLRSSFELVIERQPDLTARFYAILFERYPQAQGLFGRRARAAQEKMLAEAIVAVLDHLEQAEWLRATLVPLGAKHVDYGVTDVMYGWVGECLLAAIAEAAGDAWSPELAHAWTEAYGAIAGLMLEGAHAVALTRVA